MYDKWNLERNPFYTRPIDKSNLDDFAVREQAIDELVMASRSREGVIAITGERGVGTTSLSNYFRFTREDAYTFKYEIRIEEFDNAAQVLEAIVYSLASDMTERRISSKTARKVMDEYNRSGSDLKLSAKVGGVGFTLGRGSKTKNIMPVLVDFLVTMVNDITRKRAFKYCVFQMNNFDSTTMEEKKLTDMLNVFRDIFHTPVTVWYLLGDSSFYDFVHEKVERLSSIIRHWIRVDPITPDDFYKIFMKRIDNSGKFAVSPLTKQAVYYLSRCTMGRPRIALDIAGRLADKFGDNPYVKQLTPEIVEEYADEQIEKIAMIDQFSPTTIKILRIIKRNPGKSSSEIAKLADIPGGNLTKYVNPLVKRNFVRSVKKGRTVTHFPHGLGVLIKG
jgi:hypothetical protein